MENKKENKGQVKTEYTLSNENIKFATFLDEELDSFFQKEGMTKEILIENLSKIIDNLKLMEETLTDITQKDKNTFNTLCIKYKINSYDFIIQIKLILELASIIFSKIQGNNNQINQLELENFFPKEKNDNNKVIFDIIESQYKEIDKDYSKIKSIISRCLENIKHISETSGEIGIPFMCYLLKFYSKFILKTKSQLDLYISIENFNNKDIKIYRKNMIIYFDLIFMLQNMVAGYTILYNGYLNDKNDIFNFEENSDEWANLKKIMFRVNCKELDKVKDEYKKQNDGMSSLLVYLNKVNLNSNIFLNLTKVAGSAIKYKMNSDENLRIFEEKEGKLLSNKILVEEGFKIFKIKMVKNRMLKSFPQIKFREKIYMKREQPEISLDYIKSLLMKIYDKDTILKNFEGIKQPEREILDEKILSQFPVFSQKLKKEDKKYFVSTRLLNYCELNINKNNEEEKKNFNLLGLFSGSKKNNDKNKIVAENKPDSLLIHIHGGGFLESSTFPMENFLRETSNECKIPIIGINYGCAPKHKYPEGLNDCFQAYMWILNHCEQELGVKPEKILISGDSAGGSLAFGLVLLIIAMNKFDEKKIKVPDLILALYPCCTLSYETIALSGCIGFDNLVLPLKDTSYMGEAYRGYYKNELDPFLNQMKADENLLKDFPVTRFLTATHDGLRDEAIRFANKLSKFEGNNLKVYDLTYFDHGFMGNDNLFLRWPPHNIFFEEIKEFIKK